MGKKRMLAPIISYKNDTFDRVMTSTGYYDGEGLHSFVRDWQGNVRGVARRIGATPTLEQTTFYYPYGLPMAESTAPELNRCKYTGKEYLTHAALNISDFDARILDHTIPRFLSTDALSHKNTPHSSYIYCNADPINLIDPTGNDGYVLDSKGYITQVIPDNQHDYIDIVNNSGELIKGNRFEKGVIETHEEYYIDGIGLDVYSIKDDEHGFKLFEFVSENTKRTNSTNNSTDGIEFSLYQTSKLNKGPNLLLTSHIYNAEISLRYLKKLGIIRDCIVRTFIHNHPSDFYSSTDDLEAYNTLIENPKFPEFLKTLCYIYYNGFYREFDGNDFLNRANIIKTFTSDNEQY